MSYTYQTWLAAALRGEGCRVDEQSGWQTRGRPSSTGSFAPYGLLWHHTGTKSSAANPCPTLGMCISGRSDLAGPLAQVVIGYDGVCHVIAAGRANHAGKNKGSGPIPAGDGNAQMIGFEVDYDGTQKMSSAQYQASIKAAAAVLNHFKRAESYGRGHKETSTTGKWDPGGYDMNTMRADTKREQAAGPVPPTPTPEPSTAAEDDDMFMYQHSTKGLVLVGPGKVQVQLDATAGNAINGPIGKYGHLNGANPLYLDNQTAAQEAAWVRAYGEVIT